MPARRRLLGAAVAGLAIVAVPAVRAGAFEDFFIAVRNDRVETVRDLLARGMSPNTRNDNGSPALMEAIKEDSWKVYDLLLATKGIDINILNPANESPLMYLAIKGETARAQALIARGAEVNKPGWAPLHYAATIGDVPLIALLIEESAFIDASAPNNTTPLMMAARHGHEDAVKLLLDEGADSTMKNDLGMDAADFARSMNHQALAEALRARIASDRRRREQGR